MPERTGTVVCVCGGWADAPEHGLSQRHFEYTTRAALREQQFMEAIQQMAGYLGWKTYHTHDSRRSEPGFPDLVLVKINQPVKFREVKTEKGRLTKEQDAWITLLALAGADVGVWRPRDWDLIEKELTRG